MKQDGIFHKQHKDPVNYLPHSSPQTSTSKYRYHIPLGPAQGVHMLEFYMWDSGGGQGVAENDLRKVRAQLPCEHFQDMELLLARYGGHPNLLASSQRSTIILTCPVLNFHLPLPHFPAKVRETYQPSKYLVALCSPEAVLNIELLL